MKAYGPRVYIQWQRLRSVQSLCLQEHENISAVSLVAT